MTSATSAPGPPCPRLLLRAHLVATFDEPVAPGGPQVFVIGAPIEIAVPLEELALA